MTAVIEARGLAKTYRAGTVDVLALRGVDVTVRPGEFVAVVGPSGCGKSTLLNLLGGLDRPTAGELRLGGRRVDGHSVAEWARLRRSEVGFVFQAFHLLDAMTVLDNVAVPARLAGVRVAAARARAAELLEALGLAGQAGKTPAQLSGGEQQRVALARALTNRPAVVLADEPTGNLDTGAAQAVLALLAEQRTGEQALVLVTHDARVAAAADRVVRLLDGLVIGETALAPRRRPDLSGLLDLEDWR